MGCNIATSFELPPPDCSIPNPATIAYNGGSGNPSCNVGGGGLTQPSSITDDYDIAMTHFGQQFPFATHSYSDSLADSFLTNCRKRVMIVGRWDIYFNYNFDNRVVDRSDLEWGTLCPHPTFAMGSTPRDGYAWASAVAQLAAAGYSQDPTNLAAHPPSRTSNPYRIVLNATSKRYWVVGNKMDVNDDNWINLYCKYIKNLIDNTSATSFMVTPQKVQQHRTGGNFASADAFAHWLQGTTGTTGTGCRQQGNICQTCDPTGCVPWDLATDTGGPKGPWADAEIYDDPSEGVCDLFEGMFKLCDCLKGMGVETFFSLDNSHVRSNRNAVHWRQFQDEWVAKYGGTFADARQWFWDEVERMAQTMDGVMIDTDFVGVVAGPATYQPYEPSATWYDDLMAMATVGIESPIQDNACQQY